MTYPQGGGQQSGPQIQKVGVPTAATLDQGMLETINDIREWVPPDMLDTFFGWFNNPLGMGKLTPNEGRAMILAFENAIDYYIMSIRPYQAKDPKLIVRLESALNFVKVLCRKAVTTNTTMNERAWIAQGPNPQPLPSQAPRKKLFGIF